MEMKIFFGNSFQKEVAEGDPESDFPHKLPDNTVSTRYNGNRNFSLFDDLLI